MMPLSLAEVGEVNVIKKVSGRPEIKQHLENMGFVVGSDVTVISEVQGNIIVNVKNVRVAIGKEMANKIMI
ncbi:MAG: ferrous iron transport protein A [Erysipelotrichaceae bacterium]|nr:ferrous iron transport protein A [Erysipelotrichaceae bacterium]